MTRFVLAHTPGRGWGWIGPGRADPRWRARVGAADGELAPGL